MKKSVTSTLLALLLTGTAGAAVQITPAGGSTNGLSWSMGQLGSATFLSADGSTVLTQGILQAPDVAYASIAEVGVQPGAEISVDGDRIVIACDSAVDWSLYDSAGRRVAAGSEKDISIRAYAVGVYILKLAETDGKTTFKKILKR